MSKPLTWGDLRDSIDKLTSHQLSQPVMCWPSDSSPIEYTAKVVATEYAQTDFFMSPDGPFPAPSLEEARAQLDLGSRDPDPKRIIRHNQLLMIIELTSKLQRELITISTRLSSWIRNW